VTDEVEVWVDADFLERTPVGTLSHDRGTLRFAYDAAWLKNPQAFALDPDLSLGEGTYFPNAEAGNFRVFDDSAPDRWGQTLMKRREALAAKDEGRKPRSLYTWDFLLGVEDVSRQGALRYRRPGEEAFLAHDTLTVPPAASLRELEIVAREITAKRIDDLAALRQWLKVLVAPGASLGGARPKASFTETNGTLWIAKFPARDDTRDVGAWEALAHRLAARAGIEVPASELHRFSGEYHTFCVQRFDRSGVRRRFYASAMALLRKDQSEGTSYLELAEFLHALITILRVSHCLYLDFPSAKEFQSDPFHSGCVLLFGKTVLMHDLTRLRAVEYSTKHQNRVGIICEQPCDSLFFLHLYQPLICSRFIGRHIVEWRRFVSFNIANKNLGL